MVNFEHNLYIFLMFLLLTLSEQLFAGVSKIFLNIAVTQ